MTNTIEKLIKDIKLELLNLELGYVTPSKANEVHETVEASLKDILIVLLTANK